MNDPLCDDSWAPSGGGGGGGGGGGTKGKDDHKTTYDFDDDVIEGDLVRPDGDMVAPRARPPVPERARATIDAIMPRLVECRKQGDAPPDAILVTIGVNADGTVAAVRVDRAVVGEKTATCIEKTMREIHFRKGQALLFDIEIAP
jgi:hypothetical protein